MIFLFLLILLTKYPSFFCINTFFHFLSFFSHMPQLDFFFFFSCYISFFFFLGGFFAFHTWSLPFLLSFTKFSSNRIYYYYFSFLFFSSNSICVFFLDYFFSIFQLIYLYNKLIIYNSVSFFFSDYSY